MNVNSLKREDAKTIKKRKAIANDELDVNILNRDLFTN